MFAGFLDTELKLFAGCLPQPARRVICCEDSRGDPRYAEGLRLAGPSLPHTDCLDLQHAVPRQSNAAPRQSNAAGPFYSSPVVLRWFTFPLTDSGGGSQKTVPWRGSQARYVSEVSRSEELLYVSEQMSQLAPVLTRACVESSNRVFPTARRGARAVQGARSPSYCQVLGHSSSER